MTKWLGAKSNHFTVWDSDYPGPLITEEADFGTAEVSQVSLQHVEVS